MSGGDHAEFNAFVRRILRAYGRRVSTADPEDLAELLAVQVEVSAAIDRAVAGLRDNGFSWAQIAAATGTTRQAAQQRWGWPRERGPRAPLPGPDGVKGQLTLVPPDNAY